MEVYLDNSATTRCYDQVGDLVRTIMCKDYGNPSSLHLKGIQAERHLKIATRDIGNILKVNEKEIIYTSGGTESNNLAVIGGAVANKRAGNHIITTEIEHPAVTNSMKHLEEEGFEVTYLPVDRNGIVCLQKLEDSLRADTILVSVTHVNNEIGSIQPLESMGEIIKKHNQKTLFHSDGVQGYGKIIIYPKRIGLDMYSASGHKIHGPKGVGFLYKKEGVKIVPITFGGNQQKGLRSGTDNVPGVAGMALASKIIYQDIEEKQKRLAKLKCRFLDGLANMEDVHIKVGGVPHIISVAFKGIRSEVLLHALEEKGIYISAGSACSSYSKKASNTLIAIGIPKDLQESTVRFSMSEFTTKEEIDYTLESLYQVVPVLRRFVRR